MGLCIIFQQNVRVSENQRIFRAGFSPEATMEDTMSLSAPTNIVFIISLVIAILGLLAGLGVFAIIPISAFWLMTIAYAILALACLLKGM